MEQQWPVGFGGRGAAWSHGRDQKDPLFLIVNHLKSFSGCILKAIALKESQCRLFALALFFGDLGAGAAQRLSGMSSPPCPGLAG